MKKKWEKMFYLGLGLIRSSRFQQLSQQVLEAKECYSQNTKHKDAYNLHLREMTMKLVAAFFKLASIWGGSICFPVAGAFDMRVTNMTKGILVRKLACWHQLIHCYYSDIPEQTIHISFWSTKCVPENISLILRFLLISPLIYRFLSF